MTAAWSAPTTADEVARRAGGRKHYNSWRRWLAFCRRHTEVARRLFAQGAWTRGVQARLARELGVSRATICRDVQYLLRQGQYPCLHCRALGRLPKPLPLSDADDGETDGMTD